jgi:hypothetical protein
VQLFRELRLSHSDVAGQLAGREPDRNGDVAFHHARTNSSWAPRGPRSRSGPSFRCANRISIFLRSHRDVSKPSVPANDRATSRACSCMSRGILRDGSFGQHCGLSGHTSQSKVHCRRLQQVTYSRRYSYRMPKCGTDISLNCWESSAIYICVFSDLDRQWPSVRSAWRGFAGRRASSQRLRTLLVSESEPLPISVRKPATINASTMNSPATIQKVRVMGTYLMACDAHAPLFWDSEPPPTFAQTPLPKSRRAILSPIICFIYNSMLDSQSTCTRSIPSWWYD